MKGLATKDWSVSGFAETVEVFFGGFEFVVFLDGFLQFAEGFRFAILLFQNEAEAPVGNGKWWSAQFGCGGEVFTEVAFGAGEVPGLEEHIACENVERGEIVGDALPALCQSGFYGGPFFLSGEGLGEQEIRRDVAGTLSECGTAPGFSVGEILCAQKLAAPLDVCVECIA